MVRHHVAAGVDRYRQSFLLTGEQDIAGFVLDVESPDFSGVDTAALDASPRYSREAQRDRAIWASDRIRLNDGWQLTAGWRRTHHRIASDRSGAGLTAQADQRGDAWHLGASWRLAPSWLAHAALATGFEPNRGSTRSGAYLPPQRQRQAEAGVRWRAAGGATASATVFRIGLAGLVMTDPAAELDAGAVGGRSACGRYGQHDRAAGLRPGPSVGGLAARARPHAHSRRAQPLRPAPCRGRHGARRCLPGHAPPGLGAAGSGALNGVSPHRPMQRRAR